jgi:quercetin dioxygenase-like cupin family protein
MAGFGCFPKKTIFKWGKERNLLCGASDSGACGMAGAAISPIAYGQGEGEVFWSFGGLVTVKATSETTGGGVGVIEVLAPKGAGSPLHVHHREDEWFYVIEGELTFWVGGRTIQAPAGSFVFGPRDIPHTFMVKSELSRFLLVVEPGGFVGFMRELSQPALTLTPPPPPTEPPDMEFIMSAAARYGIEILGPPGIPEEKA